MKIWTLEGILYFVSDHYNVSIELLKSKDRREYVVRARDVYYYLSYKSTKTSFDAIGKLVNRHHATVMHGSKKIDNFIDVYPKLREELKEMLSQIKPKNNVVVENFDLLQMTINYTKSFIQV